MWLSLLTDGCRDFVKESSRDPSKAAGKAEQNIEKGASQAAGKAQAVVSDVSDEAKSVLDSGDASSAKAKASKAQVSLNLGDASLGG